MKVGAAPRPARTDARVDRDMPRNGVEGEGIADATPAPAPLWLPLTLSLHCPICGAVPGELCHRRSNHWPRYMLARLLAGARPFDALELRVPPRYALQSPLTEDAPS